MRRFTDRMPIIIFISRLPERHMTIELAISKQQNNRKKTVGTKNTTRTVASPEFCVRGHRFGFVKRPKIINLYRTTPDSILPSMRYCIRPVCHSHTIIK